MVRTSPFNYGKPLEQPYKARISFSSGPQFSQNDHETNNSLGMIDSVRKNYRQREVNFMAPKQKANSKQAGDAILPRIYALEIFNILPVVQQLQRCKIAVIEFRGQGQFETQLKRAYFGTQGGKIIFKGQLNLHQRYCQPDKGFKIFNIKQINQRIEQQSLEMLQQKNTMAKGKNKATDLKKLIQLACSNTQQLKKQEPLAPVVQKPKEHIDSLLNRSKYSDESNKSTKSLKSITLANKLKVNSINTASTGNLFRDKQNQNGNSKDRPKKLTSSVVLREKGLLGLKTDKSMKHLKLTSSVQLNKLTSKSSRNVRLDYDDKIKKAISEISEKPKKKSLTIEDFDLGRKLGKGRFGNVYLAQEKSTGFAVAIKVINRRQLKESEMESQLLEEIKIQTYANHPNILKMYGCLKDAKNIYLLLELGTESLFKQMRYKGCFSESQAAFYIKQVIQSLKYLHSEGIIHRDIKPQNILLTSGVLKLSDFGWSRYAPNGSRQTFCGTLDYVPPQIVQGDLYDQRVDIWSLGVLCYELTTGKAPFQVPNDQERTYNRICAVEINYPTHLSPELKDLIGKILTREPGNRLSLSEIEGHPWLAKHATVGRYISREVWECWDSLKQTN